MSVADEREGHPQRRDAVIAAVLTLAPLVYHREVSLIDRLPEWLLRSRIAKTSARATRRAVDIAERQQLIRAGRSYSEQWRDEGSPETRPELTTQLEAWFDARREGRGIFKWRHYFDIYDRHLAKFVGKSSTLLEIGIAGGGSLDMWREYLGANCDLYGVDIDPSCANFEGVNVFIGDQGDRAFWSRLRSETPLFDIVIDDGGHTPQQQRVTLEEMLPRLRQGGVYICEDIHGDRNSFLGYVQGLTSGLFAYDLVLDDANDDRTMSSRAKPFQAAVHSVHVYPYVVVIESRPSSVVDFVAAKRGTEWPD